MAGDAWRERRRLLEKRGELEVMKAFAEAALAGAPPRLVAEVRVSYELGGISREEAIRKLRGLAKRYRGRRGNAEDYPASSYALVRL